MKLLMIFLFTVLQQLDLVSPVGAHSNLGDHPNMRQFGLQPFRGSQTQSKFSFATIDLIGGNMN